MDHDVVVREKMTERYLLDELDPDARDQFEEHFFECQDCATDVRAGAAFIDQSKVVLSENPADVRGAAVESSRQKPDWLAWLRPAFAAPALALLLAVVGYQNLVTYPQLSKAHSRPQVLAWAPLNIATYGSGRQTLAVARGNGFGLFVRIPPDGSYTQYTADLYNPAGGLEWSLTIPAVSVQDRWLVQVPAGDREAGTYTLTVRGTTAAGNRKDIGQSGFDLQIQK
jgi:anti-sigma factor RsiW